MSLSFFEAAPLIKLRAANCWQITVLADIKGYAASLSERGATGAGRSFELRPVRVKDKGCFHPKLCLLVGKDGPRALVGSGNLTFTGWGRNLEFADYLCPEHAGTALRDLGDFLDNLAQAPKVTSPLGDLSQFVAACRSAPEGGRARILHDLRRPIIDQLVEVVDAAGGTRSLRVISPYFGSGDGVLGLAARLKVDEVGVLVCQNTREAFQDQWAKAAQLRVTRLSAKTFGDDPRCLHGKMIEIQTKTGKRVLLSGSVNVTKAALIDGRNVELAVLRITDESSHFGWEPSTIVPNTETSSFEGGENDPVVIASFEAGALNGHILWTGNFAGRWTGAILQGARRHELSAPVVVDDRGALHIVDERLSELAVAGGALQIELWRGNVCARGWVLLADFLAAVRQRGALAEAVIRIIAGMEDVNDLETILLFAAKDPSAFARAANAADRNNEPRDLGNRLIAPGALVPRSTTDGPAPMLPGALSAFDRLLQSLRSKFHRPGRTEGDGDEEQDEDTANEGDEKRKSLQRRVRAEYFEKFFVAFEDRIANATEEADRRDDLDTLLGFIRFFADHLEDSELRRADLHERWRRLAARHRRKDRTADKLDAEYALGVCAQVLAGLVKPMDAHGELQRYWNGVTPEGLVPQMQALIKEGTARQWARFATEAAWLDTIETTLNATTQWQNARLLLEAVRACQLPQAPQGFETHRDLEVLRVLIGDRRMDRVVAVADRSVGNQVCPGCNMRMSSVTSGLLRQTRLAQCDARRCGRMVIDVLP